MRSIPASLLFVLALASPGCGGGSVPPCLVFTPEHPTVDGVVRVGSTWEGDRVEDVVVVGTGGFEGGPAGGITLIYQVSCDDPSCTPDIECSPDVLDRAGDGLRCDVVDAIAANACAWTCQLGITGTVLDSGACRDAVEVVELDGAHQEPATAGR